MGMKLLSNLELTYFHHRFCFENAVISGMEGRGCKKYFVHTWSLFSPLTKCRYKQESPPVWTQEAYRPPHSTYLLCCSVSWWGGGYPMGRYPHPVSMGGYPHSVPTGTPLSPDGGYPGVPPPPSARWGYPHIDQMGHPHQEGSGYPPVGKDGGASHWNWMWYPPGGRMGITPPLLASVNKLKILPSLIHRMRAVTIYFTGLVSPKGDENVLHILVWTFTKINFDWSSLDTMQ